MVPNQQRLEAVARTGLPEINFHGLRHTTATLLMALGVPVKVVSELLGHANVVTTLREYEHALPTIKKDAVRALEEFFGQMG